MQSWFKQLVYALILMIDAGIPCVFFGDLLGIPHDNIQPVDGLKEMVLIRHVVHMENNVIILIIAM